MSTDRDTPHPRSNRAAGSGGSWIVDPATGERRLTEAPTRPPAPAQPTAAEPKAAPKTKGR